VRALAFAAVLCLGLGGVAQAGDERSTAIVTGYGADLAKCNAGNAIRLSQSVAAREGGRFRGRCVAIEGYWRGRVLFRTRRDGEQPRSNVSEALEGRRVGLYAGEEIPERAEALLGKVTVVGVLDDCQAAWVEAGRPMMVLGYCHASHGAFLRVTELLPRR
jgi:hypothetical protein